jgi:hypothetical protein
MEPRSDFIGTVLSRAEAAPNVVGRKRLERNELLTLSVSSIYPILTFCLCALSDEIPPRIARSLNGPFLGATRGLVRPGACRPETSCVGQPRPRRLIDEGNCCDARSVMPGLCDHREGLGERWTSPAIAHSRRGKARCIREASTRLVPSAGLQTGASKAKGDERAAFTLDIYDRS